MKRLLPAGLATVLFIGFISFNYQPTRPVYRDLNKNGKMDVYEDKSQPIAIVRLNTPYYPIESPIMMAKMFHHGDLDFKGTAKDGILQLLKTVPTIVDINLDRPAVIPEISAAAKGLLAGFGASDAAVPDIIFGKAKPGGKLPFELPSSMEPVRNQKEDLPYDSKDPLYLVSD